MRKKYLLKFIYLEFQSIKTHQSIFCNSINKLDRMRSIIQESFCFYFTPIIN